MEILTDDMIGLKIQLYPNPETIETLKEYFGASRYVYNYVINREKDEYLATGKFLNKYDMDKEIIDLRKRTPWLSKIHSTSLKYRMFDCIRAFLDFFKKRSGFPKYKSKKEFYQMTCIRGDRIKIRDGVVYCPGLGWIECGPLYSNSMIGNASPSIRHPEIEQKMYYNARIVFDGHKYWLSLSMKREDVEFKSVTNYGDCHDQNNPILGIDLGAKGSNWIVDSYGNRVELPDYHKENKKIRHLNKKLQRQIKATTKRDKRSNNRIKTLMEMNKYYKRKTNRRRTKVYQYVANTILPQKPSGIVLEDIKAKHMIMETIDQNPSYLKGKLVNPIVDASFYDTAYIIAFKAKIHNIPVYFADAQYPSTQRCSCCGNIMKIGKHRTYKCNKCGLTLDRDYNAALNLAAYPSL